MSFNGFGDNFGVPDDGYTDITLEEAMDALKDDILADHYFEAKKLSRKRKIEGKDVERFMRAKPFRAVIHDAIMKDAYDKQYVFKKLDL